MTEVEQQILIDEQMHQRTMEEQMGNNPVAFGVKRKRTELCSQHQECSRPVMAFRSTRKQPGKQKHGKIKENDGKAERTLLHK